MKPCFFWEPHKIHRIFGLDVSHRSITIGIINWECNLKEVWADVKRLELIVEKAFAQDLKPILGVCRVECNQDQFLWRSCNMLSKTLFLQLPRPACVF